MDNNLENVFKYLDNLCQQKLSNGMTFCLAYIDMDNTKINNISPSNIVEEFTSVIKKVDISEYFYLGRDEFAIIFSDDDLNLSLKKLHELRNLWLGSSSSNITFSAGIVMFPYHGTTSEDLWRKVEEGLYKAKRGGRDLICQPENNNLVLKSNYYYRYQLERLKNIAIKLNQKESELLRIALDEFFRNHDEM